MIKSPSYRLCVSFSDILVYFPLILWRLTVGVGEERTWVSPMHRTVRANRKYTRARCKSALIAKSLIAFYHDYGMKRNLCLLQGEVGVQCGYQPPVDFGTMYELMVAAQSTHNPSFRWRSIYRFHTHVSLFEKLDWVRYFKPSIYDVAHQLLFAMFLLKPTKTGEENGESERERD